MPIMATRYKDCEAALTFLRDVVGLEAVQVYRDDAGAIQHVEMRSDTGWLMFGPERDNDFAAFMVAPHDAGGETATAYVVVTDVAAHHARAVAAGATIVQPLREESYGGTAYILRDAEGHIWSIGSYDPRLASA